MQSALIVLPGTEFESSGQKEQLPVCPYLPALHTQADSLALAVDSVVESDGQPTQAAAPTPSLYLPLTHAVQLLPGPV